MSNATVLIAGIGNIFHGDDAFGVEVAQRLTKRSLPEEVRLVDFGIRSYDLAFALLDGYEVAILIDAASRGQEPGTLYTMELDPSSRGREDGHAQVDAHSMNPMRVLEMAAGFGGALPRILLVGCEPLTLGSEEEGEMGLSAPVLAAVDEAVDVVESLVSRILNEQAVGTAP